MEEILDAQRPGCPREFFNIKVDPDITPHFDPARKGDIEMPVLRSRYDQRTGYSPNNPRQQVSVRIHLYCCNEKSKRKWHCNSGLGPNIFRAKIWTIVLKFTNWICFISISLSLQKPFFTPEQFPLKRSSNLHVSLFPESLSVRNSANLEQAC